MKAGCRVFPSAHRILAVNVGILCRPSYSAIHEGAGRRVSHHRSNDPYAMHAI